MAKPEHCGIRESAPVPSAARSCPRARRGTVPKCLLRAAMAAAHWSPSGTVVLPPLLGSSRRLPTASEQLGHYHIVRLLGAGGKWARCSKRRTARHWPAGRLEGAGATLDLPEARERFFPRRPARRGAQSSEQCLRIRHEEIRWNTGDCMELRFRRHASGPCAGTRPVANGATVDCVLQLIAGLEAAQWHWHFCIAMLSLPTVIGPRKAPSKSAISVCRFRQHPDGAVA